MLVPSKHTPLISAKPIKNCQQKKTRKAWTYIIFSTKLAPFLPFGVIQHDSTFNTHRKTPQTDEPRQGMDRGIQVLGTFVVKVPKDVQRRLFFRSGVRRPISVSVLDHEGSRGAFLGSWGFFPNFCELLVARNYRF